MKIILTLLMSFLYFFTNAQNLSLEPNLAVNGTIISFSSTISPSTRPATNAINGKDDDYDMWSAKGFPQFIEIDLGSDKNIQGSQVSAYLNRIYQYKIEARESDGTYSTVVDKTSNKKIHVNDFWSKKARYVKLTITGTSAKTESISIREFYIYGN